MGFLNRYWNYSENTHDFLLKYAPTNIILRALIRRGGARWSTVTLLIGVAYMALAVGCIFLIQAGWNEVLYLPFLLFLVNSLKFVLIAVAMFAVAGSMSVYERRLRSKAARTNK